MTEVVDQKARDDVRDVRHNLASHVQVTEIQLKNLDEKLDTNHETAMTRIGEVRSAILWAGGLILSVVLSVLGWSILQQINANESQKNEMAQQMRLLEQAQNARDLQIQNDKLAAGAAISSSSSGGN